MIDLVLLLGYDFLAPNWLYLLILTPFIGIFLYQRENRISFGFKYTQSSSFQQKTESKFVRGFRWILLFLKIITFILLVFSISRPFSWDNTDNSPKYGNGIEILFVLDVSESMQAMDLKPNRITAAKKVIESFVNSRNGDRIGLITYAGEAYTVCPRTADHDLLLSQLRKSNGEDLVPGTAIGIGLGTAVAQLKGDSTESKAIILLTDGTNNSGELSPEDAAGLAKGEKIRVYTIGVGTNGLAPMPNNTPFGMGSVFTPVEIDETVLKNIASLTDAKYFRATNTESLQSVLTEIDKIEKKRIKDSGSVKAAIPIPRELLLTLLILGIFLLTSDLILFKGYE